MKIHTDEEIVVKLHQADEMARGGKFQQEIAHALGISVMTYHRWRKLQHTEGHGPDVDRLKHLHEVELENSRLRQLVIDLALENVGLEEQLSARLNQNLLKLAR
jgi:putative transposase